MTEQWGRERGKRRGYRSRPSRRLGDAEAPWELDGADERRDDHRGRGWRRLLLILLYFICRGIKRGREGGSGSGEGGSGGGEGGSGSG